MVKRLVPNKQKIIIKQHTYPNSKKQNYKNESTLPLGHPDLHPRTKEIIISHKNTTYLEHKDRIIRTVFQKHT